MSVKVEKLENNAIKLEITVDKAVFEQGVQKSYQKNVGKYNIPGFRKGKAPRKIIEQYYGEGVFYEDAINIVCGDAYEAAVEENNIEPVDVPEVDIIQIGNGDNLIFTATVTVKPEVKLGKYKGIEVKEKEIKVTDEQINEQIDKLREKNARIISIEDRPVKNGDITDIDFEGFIDGVAFQGGKGENYELEIGSGQFIPGFEEQLIGANKGDMVDVNVNFPDEYHSEDLKGKPALFKVKVNDIKFKEMPEIDDEFVKDVSEFDTLKELKEDIKNKLKEEQEHHNKHEIEDEIINIAGENATIDIPEAMIEKQIETMLRDFNMKLRYQGLDLNKYLQLTGSKIEDLKNNMREDAKGQVRARLMLEAVAKAENIDATQEDIDNEIAKLAEGYKQNIEDFKKHLGKEDIKYIKEGIIFDRTIDLLVENAKITKKK